MGNGGTDDITTPEKNDSETGVTLSFMSRCKVTIRNSKLIMGKKKDGGMAIKGVVIF